MNPIDRNPDSSFGGMLADTGNAMCKIRIVHAGHGEQKLSFKRAVVSLFHISSAVEC
jgi:hypothetical protein